MNEITNKNQKITMSNVINNKKFLSLCDAFQLTQAQRLGVFSQAMRLSNMPTLKNCDMYSLSRFCLENARYGFALQDDYIYPVPYGGVVQAQVGYKAFREVAMRTGEYNLINATEVYECDKVRVDRTTGSIVVDFNEDFNARNGKKIIGYFAYALNKQNQLVASVFFTTEDMAKWGKTYSKNYGSIWGKDQHGFNAMAKKTCIKQVCRLLKSTKNTELDELIKFDQKVYNHGLEEGTYADNPQNNIDIFDENGEIQTEPKPLTQEEINKQVAEMEQNKNDK